MLLHVKQDGGIEFPVTLEELKKRFPLTSFCEPLTKQQGLPEGYWVVRVEDPLPDPPYPERVVPDYGEPEWNGREWVRKWNFRPYTESEVSDIRVSKRLLRNKLLQETDWTQLPDVPESISSKFREYRQALRNAPQDPNFPFADFPQA